VTEPELLSSLRAKRWSGVPQTPGVYWWYFPRAELDRLRIGEYCELATLRLRYASDGKVCLYHGMANSLAERVEWHAAQKLTLRCIESGFLSTFRFTLLALNDFDYLSGSELIDRFIDSLSVSWQPAESRDAAEAMERAEFQGEFHYPLNIQDNRSAELAKYIRYLKSTRSAYRLRYVK
jgi:GIY-YIG catalytic domain